ncbi:unnamed protein product [Urochloa humidicola]
MHRRTNSHTIWKSGQIEKLQCAHLQERWDAPVARAASGGTATRELLEPLTPGGDLVITDFDVVINSLAPLSMEYLMAEGLPTPTSALSTNASPKLPLLLPQPRRSMSSQRHCNRQP